MKPVSPTACLLVVLPLAACGGSEPDGEASPAGGGTAATTPVSPASPADGRSDGGHHGEVLEIGTTTVGPWSVRVARDDVELGPAADVPFDVWVESGPDVTAVRLWIGREDAVGSMKVLLPRENEQFHAHAEAPDPLPETARVWVEIEGGDGETHLGSVALR